MMMDVRFSLLKLTIGGGCVVGSTVFPLLLAGEGITWGTVLAATLASVAAGNTANAIDTLTEGKDGDRVSLDNEDLTQAVGKAIAAVITLAAKQQRGKIRQYIEKIAAQAKDNWVEIAQRELAQKRYPQLREAKLDKFLTPEEYQLTQQGNLTATEWGDIFIRLNMAACKGGGFPIASEVREEVAQKLHTTFPKALRETLKEDFAKDGKAFAGLTLQLLTGMQAQLNQLRTDSAGVDTAELSQILQQFQQMETQLQGSITQQQAFFSDIADNINSGFAQVCQQLGVMETTITGLLQTLEERLKELHQEVKEFRQEMRQGLAAMQYPSEERSLSTDEWQDICRQMLERKMQLTSNTVLGQVYGNRNLIDEDLFVDLALVKPKRSENEKHRQDIDPERGSDLFARQEVEKRFAYREFLDEIIGKRTEKNIAIIGEPGAGKTTLLQKLAFWLLQQTDDLVIWVDLAELGNRPLGEYLETQWLKEALGQSREEIKGDWEQKFQGGAVWLLLDGLDEMSQSDQQALKFRGWVTDARMIVTCRLNLWQANPKQLQGFQTYLTQPFQDEQVQEFIRRWFRGLVESGEAVELAESLWSELQAAGKERIKDLCRNPLRLTLLCATWKVEDALPETTAELYAGFVEAMYEWKEDRFEVTEEEKEQLNAALGALAKASLEAETSRFRLTHRLVCEYLGKPKAKGSLCSLALRLGWLNEVGVAAENRREKVYGFYHATFQEYFAALAMDDWDYFLPKDHVDCPVEGKRYRIFEKQWKQVILLWLGREDIVKTKEDIKAVKQEFIQKLIHFDDGCGEWNFADINIGFYEYQAYCLAATGMTEFKNSSLAGTMVEQIVKWAFGYFNEKTKQWQNYIDPLRRNSKYITLLEVDPNPVFDCMRGLIDKNSGATWLFVENGYGYVLKKIARIHRKNKKVVEDILNDVLQILWKQTETQTPEIEKARLDIVYCLVDLDPSNVNIKETVLDLIEKSYNGKKGQEAAEMLDEFSFSNQKNEIINSLHHIAQKADSIYARIGAAYGLSIIDPMNLASKSKEILNDIIHDIEQEIISLKKSPNHTRSNVGLSIEFKKQDVTFAAYILGKVDPGNLKAISVLENRARLKDQVLARAYLGCIDPGNDLSLHLKTENSSQDDEQMLHSDLQEQNALLSETIPGLIDLLQTAESRMIQHDASRRLRNCITTNILREEVVSALKAFPDIPINEDQYAVFNDDSYYDLRSVQRYELFWHCAENLPYPDFYRAWHNPPTTPHPEITDQTPHNSETTFAPINLAQTLQNQPILILNAQPLAKETRESEIALTLSELIWDTTCPDQDPPKPSTPAELRRHLKQLQRRHLLPHRALLLTDCQHPTPALITFCEKLTGVIAVAFLTDEPLEAPLKGFPPNQPNLSICH